MNNPTIKYLRSLVCKDSCPLALVIRESYPKHEDAAVLLSWSEDLCRTIADAFDTSYNESYKELNDANDQVPVGIPVSNREKIKDLTELAFGVSIDAGCDWLEAH